MTTRPVILLDDGGVMNDNLVRGEQWPPLVGEFFAPRLGGTVSAWTEANRIVIRRLLAPAHWQHYVQTFSNYADFERTYRLDWLGSMGKLVGVSLPSDEECIQLSQQAESYIDPRVRSAFPGARVAIEQLYREGYTLHTASGESSVQLSHCLEAMGVRYCFGRLYGADLLNTLKDRPEYYTRLFADLQIAPADTLIVDDSAHNLARARALGARTLLVGATEETGNGTMHIRSLAELPALLQQIA